MNRRTALTGLLLATCLSWPALAAPPQNITLGVENGWYPYSGPEGQGMANELVTAAFASVGIKVTLVPRPFSRLLFELDHDRYTGIFNVEPNERNRQRFVFGKTPVLVARANFYHYKPRPMRAADWESLNGEKVGLVLGYDYGDVVNQRARISRLWANSETDNLKLLTRGDIDATVMYDKTANYLIRQLGWQDRIGQAFAVDDTPFTVAFSPRNPHAHYYAGKLDEGLARIKASGQYQSIAGKY